MTRGQKMIWHSLNGWDMSAVQTGLILAFVLWIIKQCLSFKSQTCSETPGDDYWPNVFWQLFEFFLWDGCINNGWCTYSRCVLLRSVRARSPHCLCCSLYRCSPPLGIWQNLEANPICILSCSSAVKCIFFMCIKHNRFRVTFLTSRCID